MSGSGDEAHWHPQRAPDHTTLTDTCTRPQWAQHTRPASGARAAHRSRNKLLVHTRRGSRLCHYWRDAGRRYRATPPPNATAQDATPTQTPHPPSTRSSRRRCPRARPISTTAIRNHSRCHQKHIWWQRSYPNIHKQRRSRAFKITQEWTGRFAVQARLGSFIDSQDWGGQFCFCNIAVFYVAKPRKA